MAMDAKQISFFSLLNSVGNCVKPLLFNSNAYISVSEANFGNSSGSITWLSYCNLYNLPASVVASFKLVSILLGGPYLSKGTSSCCAKTGDNILIKNRIRAFFMVYALVLLNIF